jgi:transcriptional regulator with XRE-family HTH domain
MTIPANRIRELRERRGWTQEELAAQVGGPRPPHFTTIEKLENRKRRLSWEWLEKIAGALGVPPADLLSQETFERMVGRRGIGGRRREGELSKAAALNFRTDPVTYARVRTYQTQHGISSITKAVERLVRRGLDGDGA